jgi:acyl-CoA thioesterase YciA
MDHPAIKVIAMPSDTNPDGNMFGGWIVSMMDLAGAVEARKVVHNNLVTVAIDNIVFHNPVFVGDCVECYTKMERIGRTSVTVKVDVFVQRKDRSKGDLKEKVTEGSFVFVAIGADRRPVPIVP